MSNQERLINIPTKIKYFKKTSSTFVLFEIFAVLSIHEKWTKVLKILNLSVDPKLTDTCKWIFITIIAIDVPAHIIRNGAIQIISI